LNRSAVAPAGDGELVGIGDAARDHRVDTRHDVAVVSAAPIWDVAAHELLTVTRRAARIGIKNRPALPRPELTRRTPVRLEANVVRSRRAAVNVDQQRIALTGAITDWLEQNALDLLAVRALPGNDLALA
jgi:hypothetical protein